MEAAREQIAAGGPQALSINAIARQLGTSGPALYRYFSSREDLHVAVVTWAYDDLAVALKAAADLAKGRRPAARFRAVAEAYRNWALEHSELYRLVFASPAGSGETATDVIVPASHRGMLVLIDVLAELPTPPPPIPAALKDQITKWARSRQGTESTATNLARALRAWTRMHGTVSLELEGTFEVMGIDGALLFDAEIESLLTS